MTTILNGWDELQSVYDEIAREAAQGDYSPEMKRVGSQLGEIHQGYFDDETGPDGAKWPEWYFRRPGTPLSHPTLNVSGRLKASLSGMAGSDHVEQADKSSLVWGTAVPYAYKHQEGGKFLVEELLIGKHGGSRQPGQTINLPQRIHVGLNEANLQPIVEGVADAVVEMIRE